MTNYPYKRQYPVNQQISYIKDILEKLYRGYNHKKFIPPDPLQFAYRYSKHADMEIAALLAAVLAYGNIQQIEKSLNNLFDRMGKSPHEFVLNFGETQRRELLDFKHRFTAGEDICDLLELLRLIFEKKGSIEKHFLSGYNKTDANIIPALSGFCDSLLNMYTDRHKIVPSRGLKYLLAGPATGGASKRLNLFLRWMVRDDKVDLGLWKSIDKAKLIVPMDVHIFRVSKMLGFCRRKNINLKTAVEVTERFAQIEPDDPVKYDFALCRIGMSQNSDDWNMIEGCIRTL